MLLVGGGWWAWQKQRYLVTYDSIKSTCQLVFKEPTLLTPRLLLSAHDDLAGSLPVGRGVWVGFSRCSSLLPAPGSLHVFCRCLCAPESLLKSFAVPALPVCKFRVEQRLAMALHPQRRDHHVWKSLLAKGVF